MAIFDITQNGVTPNLTTDQTIAIQSALNLAAEQNKTVYFPSGTYLYSNNINFNCSIFGDGESTQLVYTPTNGSTSAWWISSANKFTVKNLSWSSPNCSEYVANEGANHLTLTNCNYYEVSDCYFSNTGGAVILQRSCTQGKILNNTITDVWHDSIHHTKACSDIIVSGNTIINGGDDAIAIVGYQSDGVKPERITVVNNQIYKTKYARGISVVGGKDIIISNNQIYQTYVAGIYVVAETSFNTYGSENIIISNNILDGCGNISAQGLNGSIAQQPALIVQAGNGCDINQVTIRNNHILNSANIAIASPTSGANTVHNLIVSDNIITDTTDFYGKNGTSGSKQISGMEFYSIKNLTIKNNNLSEIAGSAIYVDKSNSGCIQVTDNIGDNINVGQKVAGRFIDICDGITDQGTVIKLSGNYMSQPDKWPQIFDCFIRNTNWNQTIWYEDNICQNNILPIVSGVTDIKQTVTGSPWLFTNNYHSSCRVSVYGGVVTTISISTDGGNTYFVTGHTTGVFTLKVGQKLQVIFTKPPSITLMQEIGQ